jgi:hypothetical protein
MVAIILISPALQRLAKISHFNFSFIFSFVCPEIASSRNAWRRTSAIHHSVGVTNVIRASRQYLSFEGYATEALRKKARLRPIDLKVKRRRGKSK